MLFNRAGDKDSCAPQLLKRKLFIQAATMAVISRYFLGVCLAPRIHPDEEQKLAVLTVIRVVITFTLASVMSFQFLRDVKIIVHWMSSLLTFLHVLDVTAKLERT